MKRLIAFTLLCLMLFSASAQADYIMGKAAEDTGDLDLALQYYTESAAQGDLRSIYSLGRLHYNAETPDYEKALPYFRLAAEQNLAEALYTLGLCYEYGHGVTQDPDKAAEWYLKAAEQNYALAMNAIAGIMEDKEDYAAAMDWYLKAYELEQAHSANNIGRLYQLGLGVEKNNDTALQWYAIAGNNGSSVGAYNAATLLKDGLEMDKDYRVAALWYEKSLETQPDDVKALENLGWLYTQEEYGMTPDYEKSHAYLMHAAQLGSAYAMNLAARQCKNGIGTEKNYAEAVRLYEMYAETGDLSAAQTLGWLYKEGGYGLEKDYIASAKWLLKAADQGDGLAMCWIGDFYRDGLGVEKNEALAEEWKTKSLENGHKHAH